MDWDSIAWLRRGSRRISVLTLLSKSDKPFSANDIKKSLKIAISQASATLKELKEKKLIDCLNSDDKIGKLYRISSKGRQLLK